MKYTAGIENTRFNDDEALINHILPIVPGRCANRVRVDFDGIYPRFFCCLRNIIRESFPL
jgi:hypothetical protein